MYPISSSFIVNLKSILPFNYDPIRFYSLIFGYLRAKIVKVTGKMKNCLANLNFQGCVNLRYFNIENLKVEPNTCVAMFSDCMFLRTVKYFNTSDEEDMSYMFYNCISIKSIPHFNTSKVKT